MLQLKMKFSKSALLQYPLIYLIFISSRACLYDSYKNIFVGIILAISICMAILYSRVRNTEIYLTLLLLLGSLLLAKMLNSGGLGISYFLILASTVIGTYTAYAIDREHFLERYVKLTCFFSVVSLVFWVITFITPNLVETILIHESDYFGGTKGVLLYSYQYDSWIRGYYRNNGIFTEPGIYQIVLNSAIYALLFFQDDFSFALKTRTRYLILLVLTVITAQSTAGYFSMLIIFIGYFLTKKNSMKRRATEIVMVLFGVLAVDYFVMRQESIIYKTVIEKVIDSVTGNIDLSVSTGAYRVDKLAACWEIFKEYPLFGCGDKYTDLATRIMNGESGSGGGILYFLATTGVVTMLILCYIIIWMAWKNIHQLIPFIVYLVMWINAGFSQAEVVYGCILVFAFIGMEGVGGQDLIKNTEVQQDVKIVEKI